MFDETITEEETSEEVVESPETEEAPAPEAE